MTASYLSFPSDLPCVSRIDGFGWNHAAAVIKTPLEAGNSRQRRMHTRMPAEIALAWRCSNTQYDPLLAWLNTNGYDWFKLYLAGIEASKDDVFAKEIIVRLMSDIQVTLNPIYRQNWWTLRVSAEYYLPPTTLIYGYVPPEEEATSTAVFIPLTRFTPQAPTQPSDLVIQSASHAHAVDQSNVVPSPPNDFSDTAFDRSFS